MFKKNILFIGQAIGVGVIETALGAAVLANVAAKGIVNALRDNQKEENLGSSAISPKEQLALTGEIYGFDNESDDFELSSVSNYSSSESYQNNADDGDIWARDCGYQNFQDYLDTNDFDD